MDPGELGAGSELFWAGAEGGRQKMELAQWRLASKWDSGEKGKMSQGKSPVWVKLTKFGRNDLSPAATSLLGVGCVQWDALGWGTCKLCPITVTRSQVEMPLGCKRQEVFLKLC